MVTRPVGLCRTGVQSPGERTVLGQWCTLAREPGSSFKLWRRTEKLSQGNTVWGARVTDDIPGPIGEHCILTSHISGAMGGGVASSHGPHGMVCGENHPQKARGKTLTNRVVSNCFPFFRKSSDVWKNGPCACLGFLRMEGSAGPQGPGARWE